VIVELRSPPTEAIDTGEKKDLYEQTFRNLIPLPEEAAQQRADLLAERLHALGENPDDL
jgi:hypothetical protein